MLYAVEKPAAHTTSRVPDEVNRYRHPVLFYALATGIPWACWIAAGLLSHRPNPSSSLQVVIAVLGLAGLLAPVAVAAALIAPHRDLVRDVAARAVSLRDVTASRALLATVLPLAALMGATAISLLLGYSDDQFSLRTSLSFTAGLLPAWFTLTAAPLVEELAWHSYGTDALVARWSVWRTSIVFALLWAVWHLPLGLIKGYYQAEVVETGALATINFLVAIFPFVIIMNWLYYRCGRSILIAVAFHLAANVTNEMFATHPDTKAIQTGLFVLVAAVLVWRDRELFFAKPAQRIGQDR